MMPEQTYSITAPNGKTLDVTGDHVPTESELHDIFKQAGVDTGSDAAVAKAISANPSDSGGAALAAGSRLIPKAASVAVEIATNPNVAKTGATIGRAIGAVAPTIAEAASGNGMGALTAAALSGKTAWAGGKAGWFTAKLAQAASGPLAKALDAIAPYAQSVATLGGAQGALDLAQMADPKRSDIGVLGIGPSDTTAADQARVMSSQMKALVKMGATTGEAARTVYNAWAPFLKAPK